MVTSRGPSRPSTVTGAISSSNAPLLIAGEAQSLGGVLGEGAHQLARRIGVLQAVQKHRVLDHVVANARARPMLGQKIRRLGHALHAPRHHHVGRAGGQGVVSQHGGHHARAAHLVDGRGLHRQRQAATERRLSGGRLAQARGQDAAHIDPFNLIAGDAGARDRRADRGGAQGGGGHAGEITLHGPHGRASERADDDGIDHAGLLKARAR
jgi:hypothetical protein